MNDGTTDSFAMVTAGTWEANANNFERGTLHRARGSFWILPGVTTVTTISMAAAIVLVDLNFTNADFGPLTPGDYDITDVLWQRFFPLPAFSASGTRADVGNLLNGCVVDFDIKVKRKLTSSSQLVFLLQLDSDPAASATVTWNAISRCLIDRA